MHRLGGLEFHVLDLANAVADLGHDIILITTALPSPGKFSLENTRPNIRIIFIADTKPGDYSARFWRELPGAIEKLDSEQRFDIIHCQEFAGLFLRRFTGRTLHTVHGTMFSETPLHRKTWHRLNWKSRVAALWTFKHRLILYPLFLRMLRNADFLICDSDFTRRELLMELPALRARISMVFLGPDWSRYDFSETSAMHATNGSLRIGLLGRVQEMKGIGVALEAARRLKDFGVNFTLKIAGSGNYMEEAAGFVVANQLQDEVELLGILEPSEVSNFFRQCDVFLFPDLTQPAFGLVALEAARHGLPVVAARNGAIPEIVKDSVGWIYDAWRGDLLAALFRRLHASPMEVNRKKQNCVCYASDFTASRMAEEVVLVYGRMVLNR
jgi:glycosyltransferase involved in cell wall biosynthesis